MNNVKREPHRPLAPELARPERAEALSPMRPAFQEIDMRIVGMPMLPFAYGVAIAPRSRSGKLVAGGWPTRDTTRSGVGRPAV